MASHHGEDGLASKACDLADEIGKDDGEFDCEVWDDAAGIISELGYFVISEDDAFAVYAPLAGEKG